MAIAQNGSISGQITDGRDSVNKPIFGAQIFIEGTQYGAFTDMDGKYTMQNVTPGKYDITVSYVLIGNQKIEGVKVNPSEETIADLGMGNTVNEEVGIKIVLTKNKESENAAVNEMKNSDEVVEVVSNKEMSAKGDNKASDAAKRVSGVSIVEGKYAFIRGLSDRYSKTLINGAEIPGLDPDRVAVQLDLFPSVFIQSMNVVKTFSPDLPGDFTGGLIDIKTRESFDSLTIKASIGISFNPQVHFNSNYLGYKGSGSDWMGFDDGTRDFPDIVNNYAETNESFPNAVDLDKNDPQALEKYNELNTSLNNQIEPENFTVPVNHNFNLTFGNSKKLVRKSDSLKPSRKIGYFVGLNYRRSYSYNNNGRAGKYKLDNTTDISDTLFIERSIRTQQSKDEVLVGTLGNVFFRFNPNHKINLNFIHNHTGTSNTSYGEGYDEQVTEGDFRIRKLEYLQRSMNTAQLSGEHSFDTLFFKTPTKIDWIGSYTRSSQLQPDLRIFVDEISTNNGVENYAIRSNVTPPTRFRRSTIQGTLDAKVNLEKEFKVDSSIVKVKTGASTVARTRDFGEVRLIYNSKPGVYNGNPTEFISEETMTATYDSVGFNRLTGPIYEYNAPVSLDQDFSLKNQYIGKQNIYAYYLMSSFPISKKIDALVGARMEATNMRVESEHPDPNLIGELNNLDVLPALNMSYHFFKGRVVPNKNDSTKFKKQDLKAQFVYSRTLARPTFREIAPFVSDNFINGYSEIGNQNLDRVLIDNIDLRLEFYPNSGELISFSAFYKNFTNPIERTSTIAQNEFTWVNSEKGNLYGVEAEFRKNLGFIAPSLKKFKLGLNGSLIKSQVFIPEAELADIRQSDPYYTDDTRPLLGQSPYIANTFLQYKLDSSNITMNITYNIFGDRMNAVQQNGTPNLYEKGRQELNFNIAKEFKNNSKITFRIQNILNPEYTIFHKFQGESERYDIITDGRDYIFNTYKKEDAIA